MSRHHTLDTARLTIKQMDELTDRQTDGGTDWSTFRQPNRQLNRSKVKLTDEKLD